MRYHLKNYKFDEGHVVRDIYIGRLKHTNIFHCYHINKEIKSHTFIEINSGREALPPESRQAYSCVDQAGKYFAFSENSYLHIYSIEKLEETQTAETYHEISDYGSAITTMQFDHKS